MPAFPPPKFHGRFEIDNLLNNFRYVGVVTGAANLSIALRDDYFIRRYTGEGPLQLCEAVQAAVVALGGAAATFTCTVSDDGIVTMENPGENYQIIDDPANPLEWTAGLGPILGFSAALGVAAKHTAPEQHRFGWYPNDAPSEMNADRSVSGDRHAPDVVQSRGVDGEPTTTSYEELGGDRVIGFSRVPKDRVFPVGTLANRDYQQFWSDVVRTGTEFRFYRQADEYLAPDGGPPWLYVADENTAQAGTRIATKRVSAVGDWYTMSLRVMEIKS